MALSLWLPVRPSSRLLTFVTLNMFGVPLDGSTSVLGNNQAIINSTMILNSPLSKCWNALSYHHCHEAVAASICHFEYLPSIQNPSEFLTKTLPWAKACAFWLNHSSFGKVKLCRLAPPTLLTRGE